MRKVFFVVMAFMIASCGIAVTQTLDGNPYDPKTEPDIDMFISSWNESIPTLTHGNLVERAIFTRGDNPNPKRKGAVLEHINRFVQATLPALSTTAPTLLTGEQEILFVLSGNGTIRGGGQTHKLSRGIVVLVPAGLSFTITNTGEQDISMYLISEPIPAGFRPNEHLLVRNSNTIPFNKDIVHWSHIDTFLLQTSDGLGTLELVTTCTFSPMTIGHPHSHVDGTEEFWSVIQGDNIVMLGKQIRRQPVGTSYLIPNDGKTPHSNINVKDDLLKFFYFARYRDHEVRE
ncbi:cupin domain-containing protein [Candidatus Latescibacterota bacterium]